MAGFIGACSRVAVFMVASVTTASPATASVWTWIEARVESLTAVDCEVVPLRCLESLEVGLEDVRDRLSDSLTSIFSEHGKALEVAQQQRQKLAQNTAFRNLGRDLYQSGAATVEFFGEPYDRAALAAQLELLFYEHKQMAEILVEMQYSVQAIEAAKLELMSRKARVEAKLSTLPGRIALARVEIAFGESQSDLEEIAALLGQERSALDADIPTMRSTEALAAMQARATAQMTGFSEWLSAGSGASE